jgi:hypothetical protein
MCVCVCVWKLYVVITDIQRNKNSLHMSFVYIHSKTYVASYSLIAAHLAPGTYKDRTHIYQVANNNANGPVIQW